MGARFAKWRAVIAIGEGIPTGLYRGQRARAGPLCRVVPGSRTGSHCEPECSWTVDTPWKRCRAVTGKS